MRIFVACVLLTTLAFPIAANCDSNAAATTARDDAKAGSRVVEHAAAESAAAAGSASSKSRPKWADRKTAGEKAKAETEPGIATDAKAEAKLKKKRKAKDEAKPREGTRAAPTPATGRDQSVCDLSPHPDWCDE